VKSNLEERGERREEREYLISVKIPI